MKELKQKKGKTRGQAKKIKRKEIDKGWKEDGMKWKERKGTCNEKRIYPVENKIKKWKEIKRNKRSAAEKIEGSKTEMKGTSWKKKWKGNEKKPYRKTKRSKKRNERNMKTKWNQKNK